MSNVKTINHNVDYTILSFGEVLFDLIAGKYFLGGAPLNFAWYIDQIGIDISMLSAVGKDNLGERAVNLINESGIKPFISRNEFPTGTVNVHTDGSFDIVRNVAWESIQIPNSLPNHFDMIYFGTSAQSSQNNINILEKLITYHPRHIFLDLNLRKDCYTEEIIIQSLKAASILKMNALEWNVISRLFDTTTVEDLMDMHSLETVALTYGEEGASIYTPGNKKEYRPPPVKTIDATGAGDAFSAVLAAGILRNKSISHILNASCQAGANAVSQNGAMAPLPDNIKRQFLP